MNIDSDTKLHATTQMKTNLWLLHHFFAEVGYHGRVHGYLDGLRPTEVAAFS